MAPAGRARGLQRRDVHGAMTALQCMHPMPLRRTHPIRDPACAGSRPGTSSRRCQMWASDALRKAAPCRLRFGGYFVIEINSDLGWKNFDTDPVGEAVVGTGCGCGIMMIDECGGPCPLPSCATATVVTDVMSKSVTIVYFILILLERGGSTRRRRRGYPIRRQHRRIRHP
jgi:hypothetical protein